MDGDSHSSDIVRAILKSTTESFRMVIPDEFVKPTVSAMPHVVGGRTWQITLSCRPGIHRIAVKFIFDPTDKTQKPLIERAEIAAVALARRVNMSEHAHFAQLEIVVDDSETMRVDKEDGILKRVSGGSGFMYRGKDSLRLFKGMSEEEAQRYRRVRQIGKPDTRTTFDGEYLPEESAPTVATGRLTRDALEREAAAAAARKVAHYAGQSDYGAF